MKHIYLALSLVLLLSCTEEKYSKDKFNDRVRLTNKSSNAIPRVKIYGDSQDAKSWVLQDINPAEQREIGLNIQRDIKNREGSLQIVAFFDDSDSVATGLYYTNWQIIGDVTDIEIYDNKRLVVKH